MKGLDGSVVRATGFHVRGPGFETGHCQRIRFFSVSKKKIIIIKFEFEFVKYANRFLKSISELLSSASGFDNIMHNGSIKILSIFTMKRKQYTVVVLFFRCQ